MIVMLPVVDLLQLRSSEATRLWCIRGHVSGHPNVCPEGCQFLSGDRYGTVADIVQLRLEQQAAGLTSEWDGRCAGLDVPVWVENGWLVDGHHRVAVAVRDGVTVLPVEYVTGLRAKIHRHHEQVRTLAVHDPANVPEHRPTC